MSDELQIAIEAAQKGAEEALKYFEHDLKIELKKDKSQVTIADRNTEAVIKSFISSHYPNAKFVGEETGGDIKEDEFWIIDPIDGTRSFVRGIPEWCVMVSLCKNEQITTTAVYFPLKEIMYSAKLGQGAYINDKKMHVSRVSTFENAFINYGSPKYFKDKTQRNGLTRLIDSTSGARSFESTYGHCLIAEGKMDIAVDAYAEVWDMAPFKLMVEEAGGKVTKLDGSPWQLMGKGAVLSNGILHDEAINILNEK